MESKKGLLKFGYVKNLTPNEKKQNCITFLSNLVGRTVTLAELNNFIESSDFTAEYLNKEGIISNKDESYIFRFKLPWNDESGTALYGFFSREELDTSFTGVQWGNDSFNPMKKRINLKKYGYIDPACFEKLHTLCGKTISEKQLSDYITSDLDYYNGAGHTKFLDGTVVTADSGKFVRFTTSLSNSNDEVIIGWFTKGIKGKYEGISWGTEMEFRAALKLREQFYVGRMIFDSIEDCNIFLEDLKNKTIPEPWEYKRKKDDKFKYPILKSYLEFELDRLFYEQESLSYQDRIIFNSDRSKVLFNTNLIDKFGHDLIICGTLLEVSNRSYIGELEISPSTMKLRKMNFNSSIKPMPPSFFKDINEIIFHGDWEIDKNMSKYEHIIEERKDRFPEKYRELTTDGLGHKLDNAINFAKSVAQRNYKFIVPMYYPSKKRIQLLMPIYLETSYTSHPDFALVLTPHIKQQVYSPETILGLEEVYQDARLIAKPEESWLNPDIIE
jgi:hypothetical protein